jgi:hypothetical protein
MQNKMPGMLAGMLMVLLLYVVAYLFSSDPKTFRMEETPMHGPTLEYVARLPNYRFGGQFADALFKSLCAVDQKVRPSYWKSPIKR